MNKYNFDIDEITQQVGEVIKTSQGFEFLSIDVEEIIMDWLKGKESFIQAMGGNLIYESPEIISFQLDDKSKEERLAKFADLICFHYHNEPLSDFLYTLKTVDFYNNKTSCPYYCNSNITVPENYKVVKSFKFFVEDQEILHKLQSEASRIIQENTVRGRLCLSVHPLDFLSASENVHNWRSCYALDGEYRTGTLNYLMDSTTVICYLKAEDEVVLPHFPSHLLWNSKKWRVWLFFSNDHSMIFTGRQYPFENNVGIDYIKDNILPEVGLGKWTDFYTQSVSSIQDENTGRSFCFGHRLFPINGTLKPISDIMVDGKNTHMYNDVLKSSAYTPSYAFQKPENLLWMHDTGMTNNKTVFTVGKACKCPICNDNYIDLSDILACQRCVNEYDLSDIDGYCVCDMCGVSVPEEEMYTLDLTGDRLCWDCFRNETIACQLCSVEDLPDVITYYEGMYLCPICIEKRKRIAELFQSEEEN